MCIIDDRNNFVLTFLYQKLEKLENQFKIYLYKLLF